MQSSLFRRTLAVLLVCQPILWVNHVALAQVLQPAEPPSSGVAPTLPVPTTPTEPEVIRSERPAVDARGASTFPLDEPLDPDKYVCGHGDVFELNFWGVQNFKLRVVIDMEGRAFVPKVGYEMLQGKTLSQARSLLRASVGRYFPRLSFDVTLAEPRTFLVHVVDDVAHPGAYQARAVERVATVLARAGGLGQGASRRRIQIQRLDGSLLHADLLLYTLTGDVRYNPYLLDGDVVRVPFEGLSATIDGAVHRAGRYELTGARDLAELVELAGGLSPSVTRRLPIRVVRRTQDDLEKQMLLDFATDGHVPAVALQHEDRVWVPRLDELQQSVQVVGALAGASATNEASTVRRAPFVQGDSVRTLLERLGGVDPTADLKRAYVQRGGQVLPVDLHALLVLRDFTADLPVQLGDTVVVPFGRRAVAVQGAVPKAGLYPYNPTFGIEQYLAQAGGRTRMAESLSDVRLVTPTGKEQSFFPDLKVEPGDTLIVPERTFSSGEIVQILLGVAGVLLSGAAVVVVARK